MNYKHGIQRLKQYLEKHNGESLSALNTLEARLDKNQQDEFLFGVNESTRTEHTRVLHSLNLLAQEHCGISFNDLCQQREVIRSKSEVTIQQGIPANLHRTLQTTLLRCGPFATDYGINAVFVDSRLKPWHDQLPQANDSASRVQAVIAFLSEQYNDRHENALVLLLRVLGEQKSPGDACQKDLFGLASQLSQLLSG